MHLRPHHLLCIQKFTGHGYDPAFTGHMTALVRHLRTNPQTTVTPVSGADALCAACPHHSGGRCDAQEKVTAMDAAVQHLLNLPMQKPAVWSELAAAEKNAILQTDRFDEICAQCQWYPLCRRTEETNAANHT